MKEACIGCFEWTLVFFVTLRTITQLAPGLIGILGRVAMVLNFPSLHIMGPRSCEGFHPNNARFFPRFICRNRHPGYQENGGAVLVMSVYLQLIDRQFVGRLLGQMAQTPNVAGVFLSL